MKKLSMVVALMVLTSVSTGALAQSTRRLPYTAGETWWVSQGWGQGNHTGALYYAWDFNWGSGNDDLGKPVLAPAAGFVVYVYSSGGYNGGWGNTVIIDYGDGSYGKTAHLQNVYVSVDQYVLRGETIGTCGNTGTTSAHIHYQTQNSADINGQSIASSFEDVPTNGGVPQGCNCSYYSCPGTYCYTSGNYASFARVSCNTSSSTYVDSTLSDVAVDSLARAHVVWREDSATPGVYYSICTESSCTTPGLISVTSGGTAPSIAVDSADNLHLAWNNAGRIYYSKYNGSSWSTPVEISTGTQNQYLDIAVDAANHPHVVWFANPYVIYYNYFDGTSWLPTPERVDATGNALYPAIAVISDDTPQVVWEYRQSGNYEIYYSYRIGSNLWATARNISNSASYSYSPDVAADSTSVLHVVWKEASGINDIFYSRGIGASWDTPVNIANTRYDSGNPAVAVDAGDNPHVVWHDASDGNWEIFYTRWNGLAWTYRRNISSTAPYYSTFPAIAVDKNSTPQVVWDEERPPWYYRDIYYRQ